MPPTPKGSAAPRDMDAFPAARSGKDELRLVICGSVDDGKSTLLGRLLHDPERIFEDQPGVAEAENRTYGTRGDAVDLAFLLDGPRAEGEHGTAVDVACRYFETAGRKFIAVDAPGHEQYTRNLVAGASDADLAVVLVDASKGVLTQTRRHGYIVSLMGVRRAILAVNKMDLVDYDEGVFSAIVGGIRGVRGRSGDRRGRARFRFRRTDR